MSPTSIATLLFIKQLAAINATEKTEQQGYCKPTISRCLSLWAYNKRPRQDSAQKPHKETYAAFAYQIQSVLWWLQSRKYIA